MNHEYFMKIAIEEAKKGDFPYGTVIVKDGKVVSKGCNTTIKDSDPSAHAEMNTIRNLSKRLESPSLSGYILYSTCEPCAMCIGACIWAGISQIIFGVSINEINDLTDNQINLPSEEIISKGFTKIKITKGVLKEECKRLYS